jgi:DNA polymerase (family 10)
MTNSEIAAVFEDIARLLPKNRENIFKIRAYQKAARAIMQFPEPVAKLVADGRLREIPGVGAAIAKKITELVTTGKLAFLERLKSEAKADSYQLFRV